MAKSEVFFFDLGGPLWISGIKETDHTIKGWVENGSWPFIYDIRNKSVYGCTSLRDMTEKNLCAKNVIILRRTIIDNEAKASMRELGFSPGNYNDVITWAEQQK